MRTQTVISTLVCLLCVSDRVLPRAAVGYSLCQWWDHCRRRCEVWSHGTKQVRPAWLRLHRLQHWRHWRSGGKMFRSPSMSSCQHRCSVCRVARLSGWSQVIPQSRLQLYQRSEFPVHVISLNEVVLLWLWVNKVSPKCIDEFKLPVPS